MKSILWMLLLIGLSMPTYAQDEDVQSFDNSFMYNFFSGGVNIDLSPSPSGPNAGLLGARPTIAPVFASRFTYISRMGIGGYASFQLSFYKEKLSDSYYMDHGLWGNFLQGFFDGMTEGFRSFHPSFEVGAVYRIGRSRWQLHPEAGFGYGYYLSNRESSKSETTENGEELKTTYKEHAASAYLSVGASGYYFASENFFFVLNVAYHQPLKKSSAELIYTTDGMDAERISCRSTVGNRLNISLGVGVAFGK